MPMIGGMSTSDVLSRRSFLARSLQASAVLASGRALAAGGDAPWPPPIAVFSKLYQELKLDVDRAAEITAAAGLAGIDCPVRAKGEIEPEKAADEMPRYAEALRKRGVAMMLLTTDLLAAESPHAETVLRAAKRLGIGQYRLGFRRIPKTGGVDLDAIRAELKGLAALNRAIGITGAIQNHSGAYVGGDLTQMHDLVKDLNPDEMGVAFDLGHAIVTHGDDWPRHFERLAPHIRIAYVKDVVPPKQWLALGKGEFEKANWFPRVRKLNLRAPISLHVEYDWAAGAEKTYDRMLAALRADVTTLKGWMAKA